MEQEYYERKVLSLKFMIVGAGLMGFGIGVLWGTL